MRRSRLDRIVAVAEGLEAPEGAEVIEARGLAVFPGFVDLHVHFREPGFEYKETVETGCASAVAGGFTTVACMANTKPVNDNGTVTRFAGLLAARDDLAGVRRLGETMVRAVARYGIVALVAGALLPYLD